MQSKGSSSAALMKQMSKATTKVKLSAATKGAAAKTKLAAFLLVV